MPHDYNSIEARRSEIARLFVERPELSDYFYKHGIKLPEKGSDNRQLRAQVYAACEMFLTHFSSIVRQGKSAAYQPPEIWNEHQNTIRRFFSRSETLRDYYANHSDCFHDDLKAFLP